MLVSIHFSAFSARFSLFLALIFIALPFARSAELYLSNGDRITGRFLRRADGKIYFSSPLLGEISVPESQAAVVETPGTSVESLAGLPPSQSHARYPDKSGTKITEDNEPWRGTLEFGYQQQSGRANVINFSFHGTVEKKKGPNDYKAEARILYGKQNDITSTDLSDSYFRWRHELSDRVFFQSQSSYTQDRIKLINYDYEENLGFGYKLFKRLRDSANAGAGVTAQYRDVNGGRAGMSYLAQFFEDYSYRINGRLTFNQDASLLSAFRGTNNTTVVNDQVVLTSGERENYRFRFNASLQGRMTDRFSVNLRYEYEFDNTIVDPHARSDNRITTSLGYGF